MPAIRIAQSLKEGVDYREDLARYPGDPQAYVSGPVTLRRLVDQRKREGWVEGPPLDEIDRGGDAPDSGVDSMAIVKQAYQEAKAEGFALPSDSQDD